MNSHGGSFSCANDEMSSPSPKRKKARQKYAPKACVACRRSKLKCTGENPCQRCVDNARRCFYSEDETAAQALQHLSQPAPVPHRTLSNSNSDSNIAAQEGVERRRISATMNNIPMEARMARMEAMMEALLQERGITAIPSVENEQRAGANGQFRDDSIFRPLSLDAINPALALVDQGVAMLENTRSNQPQNSPRGEARIAICVKDLEVPFPSFEELQRYMTTFFCGLQLRYPCIEERSFRKRNERICAGRNASEDNEEVFAALCYMVFACCDALYGDSVLDYDDDPLGWRWFQIADSLVDNVALFLRRLDITLVQLLLFKAIYLMYSDMPGTAYTAIGLASRIALQYGFHQRQSLVHLSQEQLYLYACTFWNVFVVDRIISLSCGRPYSIRDQDIQIDHPDEIINQMTDLDNVDSNSRSLSNVYMKQSILLAFMAGRTWDIVTGQDPSRYALEMLQMEFHRLCASNFTPPTQQGHSVVSIAYNKYSVQLSFNNVKFSVLCRKIASTHFGKDCATQASQIALDNILWAKELYHLKLQPLISRQPTTRHQIVSSVAISLLTFCALLSRDLSPFNLQRNLKHYMAGFHDCLSILESLENQTPHAKRVLQDFDRILGYVSLVVEEWQLHSPAEQARGGFTLVAGHIPPLISDLFPYQSLSPPLQKVPRDHAYDETSCLPGGHRLATVLWL